MGHELRATIAELDETLAARGVRAEHGFTINGRRGVVYYREWTSSDDGVWTLAGARDVLAGVRQHGCTPTGQRYDYR